MGDTRITRLGIALVLVFTALAIAVGLRTGYHSVDIDEVVYVRTLNAMHHGSSYYDAMRRALVLKDGAPPTQVRSVRLPTMFLLVAPLPSWSWRWAVGVVYAAALALAWHLGRSCAKWGGVVAVLLVGFWVLGASPVLFLHPELWGLPFALAGVLAARRDRWAAAAACIAVAVAFRELYGVLFLAGLVFAPKRRPWVIAGLVLLGLAAVHVAYTSSILVAHGREPAFGSGSRGLAHALSSISPSDRALGWLVGAAGTVAGLWYLAARGREPGARVERMALAFAAAMVPVTILLGRVYWGLTYGPLLACFMPEALARTLFSDDRGPLGAHGGVVAAGVHRWRRPRVRGADPAPRR
jgi:hypothetical protein